MTEANKKKITREDYSQLKDIFNNKNLEAAIKYYYDFTLSTSFSQCKLDLFLLFYNDSSTYNISLKLYSSILKDKHICLSTKKLFNYYLSEKALYVGKYDVFLGKDSELRNTSLYNKYLISKGLFYIYNKDFDKAYNSLHSSFLTNNDDYYLSCLSLLSSMQGNHSEALRYLNKFSDKSDTNTLYLSSLLKLELKYSNLDLVYDISNKLIPIQKNSETYRLCGINYKISLLLGKNYLFDKIRHRSTVELDQEIYDKNVYNHILKHQSSFHTSLFLDDFDLKLGIEKWKQKISKIKPFTSNTADVYLFDENESIGTVNDKTTSKVIVITHVNTDQLITAFPTLSYYNTSHYLSLANESLNNRKSRIKIKK